MNVLLDRWASSQVQYLKKKFVEATCDKGDKELDKKGFFKLFAELQDMPKAVAESAFRMFDTDNSGKLNFREFCCALALCCHLMSSDDEKIRFVFDMFDTNDDGLLSASDVQLLLEHAMQKDEAQGGERQARILDVKQDLLANSLVVTFERFYEWAAHNLDSLNNILCTFQIVPSPERERTICEEILSRHQSLVEGSTWYCVSHKWLQVWKAHAGWAGPSPGRRVQSESSGGQGLPSSLPRDRTFSADSNELGDDTASEDQLVIVGEPNIRNEQRMSTRPPEIDNSDLEGEHKGELKMNLVEHLDYELIPEEMWVKLVEWYGGGPAIMRKVICLGQDQQPQVELYPPLVLVVVAGESGQPLPQFSRRFFISRQSSLDEVLHMLAEKLSRPAERSRLWHRAKGEQWRLVEGGIGTTLEEFLEGKVWDAGAFLLETQATPGGPWPRDADPQTAGDSAADPASASMGDKDLQRHFEVGDRVEAQSGVTNQWMRGTIVEFIQRDHSSAPSQVKVHYDATVYKCDEWISTCSDRLAPLDTHTTAAQSTGGATSSSNTGEGPPPVRGATGLQNLGNTCFLNATIQCLANTPLLREYFLSHAYLRDLNERNGNGYKGRLAEEFGHVLSDLWSGKSPALTPRNLKRTIDQFAPQFAGYEQHDAQELLAFFLDGLHEDLNRSGTPASSSGSRGNNNQRREPKLLRRAKPGRLVVGTAAAGSSRHDAASPKRPAKTAWRDRGAGDPQSSAGGSSSSAVGNELAANTDVVSTQAVAPPETGRRGRRGGGGKEAQKQAAATAPAGAGTAALVQALTAPQEATLQQWPADFKTGTFSGSSAGGSSLPDTTLLQGNRFSSLPSTGSGRSPPRGSAGLAGSTDLDEAPMRSVEATAAEGCSPDGYEGGGSGSGGGPEQHAAGASELATPEDDEEPVHATAAQSSDAGSGALAAASEEVSDKEKRAPAAFSEDLGLDLPCEVRLAGTPKLSRPGLGLPLPQDPSMGSTADQLRGGSPGDQGQPPLQEANERGNQGNSNDVDKEDGPVPTAPPRPASSSGAAASGRGESNKRHGTSRWWSFAWRRGRGALDLPKELHSEHLLEIPKEASVSELPRDAGAPGMISSVPSTGGSAASTAGGGASASNAVAGPTGGSPYPSGKNNGTAAAAAQPSGAAAAAASISPQAGNDGAAAPQAGAAGAPGEAEATASTATAGAAGALEGGSASRESTALLEELRASLREGGAGGRLPAGAASQAVAAAAAARTSSQESSEDGGDSRTTGTYNESEDFVPELLTPVGAAPYKRSLSLFSLSWRRKNRSEESSSDRTGAVALGSPTKRPRTPPTMMPLQEEHPEEGDNPQRAVDVDGREGSDGATPAADLANTGTSSGSGDRAGLASRLRLVKRSKRESRRENNSREGSREPGKEEEVANAGEREGGRSGRAKEKESSWPSFLRRSKSREGSASRQNSARPPPPPHQGDLPIDHTNSMDINNEAIASEARTPEEIGAGDDGLRGPITQQPTIQPVPPGAASDSRPMLDSRPPTAPGQPTTPAAAVAVPEPPPRPQSEPSSRPPASSSSVGGSLVGLVGSLLRAPVKREASSDRGKNQDGAGASGDSGSGGVGSAGLEAGPGHQESLTGLESSDDGEDKGLGEVPREPAPPLVPGQQDGYHGAGASFHAFEGPASPREPAAAGVGGEDAADSVASEDLPKEDTEVDEDHLPDEEKAQLQWERYRARNRSCIVDVFEGQLRSQLTCRKCGMSSSTFEPFRYLSVPIPSNHVDRATLKVIFFPLPFSQARGDERQQLTRYSVTVPKSSTVQRVEKTLSSRLPVPMTSVLLAEVYRSRIHRYLDPCLPLSDVRAEDQLFAFEVLQTPQELVQYQERYAPSRQRKTAEQRSATEEVKKQPNPRVLLIQAMHRRVVDVCRSDGRTWAQRREVFGLPFVMSAASSWSYATLHDMLMLHARRFLRPLRHGRDHHRHGRDGGASPEAERQVPFVARIVNASGTACGACDRRNCTGCLLPKGSSRLRLRAGLLTGAVSTAKIYLALDWVDSAVYDQDYVDGVAEDTSLVRGASWHENEGGELRQQDGEGVDSSEAGTGSEEGGPAGTVSVSACIDAFAQPEELKVDLGNGVQCEKCGEAVDAVKKLEIWREPDVLILHVKRFHFSGVHYEKLNTHVDVPCKELNLRPWIVGPSAPTSTPYELYGVACHWGGMSGGHYTSFCVNTEGKEPSWLKFNDDNVTSVSLPQELDEIGRQCYVLFYRKRAFSSSNLINYSSLL